MSTLKSINVQHPSATTINLVNDSSGNVSFGGNVGIGTSSPSGKLSVTGSGGTVSVGSAGDALIFSNGGTNYITTSTAGGQIQFQTGAGSNAMLLDSSGNLLVGQTSNWTSGLISTTAGNSNGISARSAASASGYSAFIARTDRTDCNLTAFYFGTTQVGSITTNTSSTAYNTSSDYRLKENVAPMTNSLATIASLRPVTYDWISDKSHGAGFIAHELQSVIPDAVTGEKDAVNEDGSIRPQGVDYSKIVVHLVAACQELKAHNDALEARLAALEAK